MHGKSNDFQQNLQFLSTSFGRINKVHYICVAKPLFRKQPFRIHRLKYKKKELLYEIF